MHLGPTALLVLCLSTLLLSGVDGQAATPTAPLKQTKNKKAAPAPTATPAPMGEGDEKPLSVSDETSSKNESVDMEEEPTELEKQQSAERDKTDDQIKKDEVSAAGPVDAPVDPELAPTPVPEDEAVQDPEPAIVEDKTKEEAPEEVADTVIDVREDDEAQEEARESEETPKGTSADELRKYIRPDVTLVEISPYAIGPFRERRPRWTTLVGLGINQYVPKDYKPNFVTTETFDSYYSAGAMPELNFSIKRNFSWVALSIEIGAGSFSAKSKDSSALSVTPIRLGFGMSFDTLFNEPYLVPYFQAGVHTMLYREAIGSQSVNGNTSASGWGAAGVRLQLDWMDEHSDRSGYTEYGMENTFLYIEGRSFLLSQTSPKLGSPAAQPVQTGAGLMVEF